MKLVQDFGKYYEKFTEKTHEDIELDDYIFNTQLNAILKSYIKGIKFSIVWLFGVSGILMLIYYFIDSQSKTRTIFLVQVFYFEVYLVIGFINVQFYPRTIFLLPPLSILVIMIVTINISNSSDEYTLSEWMLVAQALVYLVIIIVPSQSMVNSSGFILSMIYFQAMINYSYGIVPFPCFIGLPLGATYFGISSYMLNSKFKAVYKVLLKNEKLVEELRKLVELFPEAVIIHSSLADSDKPFEFGSNEKFKDQISETKLLEKLKDTLIDINRQHNVGNQTEVIKSDVFELITKHEQKLKGFEKVVNEPQVKINLAEELNNVDENINSSLSISSKIYNVKSMKINWEGNEDGFMHVFIDTTDVFRLQEAQNNIKCQKIMFTSASHEFRTPLNAILNSYRFLENIIENLK